MMSNEDEILEIGTRVEARYKGKAKYYPGVITRVRLGGKAFDIDYDDGEQEMGVKRELIKLVARDDVAETTALNDNAKGIDRFGYSAYARALFVMLHRACPPICVGLFAKWGSGKSFMIHLLKQEFDPDCEEDPNTFEIIQWFDPRYTGRHPNAKHLPVQVDRCSLRFKVLSKWFGTTSVSSLTLAWFLLLSGLFEEFYQDLRILCWGYQPLSDSDSLGDTANNFPSSSKSIAPVTDHDEEKGQPKVKKSYVFVDFNAWEFNKSDQLWVGLIRNIYTAVESRLEAYRDEKGVSVDFKRLWRAEKAKEEVIESYGGIKALRLRILLLLFCSLLLLVCIILAFCYLRELIHFFRTHQSGGVVSVLTFLAFLGATLYPILEMVFRTGKETNTSRGDRLYNEATNGRDKLGFLRHVRIELDELFKFLVETYQQKTGESLTLVIFIDDLDRCVGEGRIVAVLEALQLLLNIPGAPVIAFLAVDSRIIASSIEMTLNTSVNLKDTPVTGWEYLDKIIQVPFCLPSPPPQKIQRMLASSLAGSDLALPVVAKRLRDLITQLTSEILLAKSSPFIGFLEEESRQRRYHSIPEFLSSLSLSSKQFKDNDQELVCHAAKLSLTKFAENVELKSRGMNKKERLELICRSVNFCLYHFQFKTEAEMRQSKANEKALDDQNSIAVSSQIEKIEEHESKERILSEKISSEDNEDNEDNDLERYHSILDRISSSSRPPLVQANVLVALNEISLYLDPNPRKLKRLANILQLVTAVAQHKPVSEVNQEWKLSMEKNWDEFSLKIVKWIGLCECYPFRTSLLVQVLEDMDQKKTYGVRNPKGLLHYKGINEIDYENMTLIEFYSKFVDHLTHESPEFKKLNRLDSDPEVFMSYLSLPLSGLPGKRDILASDVLGPITDKEKGLRDLNFSLLSHSFNLNPTMRSVIALEVQQMKTEYVLKLRDSMTSESTNDGR